MTENASPAGAKDDPEIAAIGHVYDALHGLDAAAQRRVLDYVAQKLGLAQISLSNKSQSRDLPREPNLTGSAARDEQDVSTSGDDDGINPVAQRWIKRSGISTADLSTIFSIGGDEIELIAKKVPGETKKDRMHSVLLLKAMASYLASGAPRTGHKEAKEACLHYDGWDSANFAVNLKSFASEIGGSKESGYTLNARGLSSATDLIKSMIADEAAE